MSDLHLYLLFLVLISSCHECLSMGWFWQSPKSNQERQMIMPDGFISEFSMDSANNPKGIKLVENAKRKLMAPNSCWQNAYMNLFSSCSEIIADKEKQSRLAWHLSDCFQKESGRPNFPTCSSDAPMMKCLKNLDEYAHKIYLEFFLETNSICHQLQTDAFKHETERLVNDLKRSAQFAEDKLETIEERSESLLQSSDRIQNSLTSIDQQTQQVAQASKDIGDQIHDVLKHSKAIFEQSKGIQASQAELQEGQVQMKEKMEAGMALLHESYDNLGHGIEKLRLEAVEIEREIGQVGDSMTSKMQNLQSKADDIGNIAGISLDKQKELLDGQSVALEGIDFLTKFQSQALEESRATLQKLVDFGHKQQEELLQRQEQLRQAHDHLIQNSQSMLAAQEEFESKQATLFIALDKLFTLHNAILLESRFVKTFFFYACLIFIAYMLTSTKQTSAVRARIYLSICITFMIEFTLVQLGAGDINQQIGTASKIYWARFSLLLAASIQIIHSIFTYRDYEILNHQLLLTLIEKFNSMERNTGKDFLSLSMENDTCLSSSIDSDLAENEDDDDHYHGFGLSEEVEENSISTMSIVRKYDLRPRFRK